MRFSTLLTDGMFQIRFSERDLETLDQVFVAAAHHYWNSKQAREGSADYLFHQEACELHCTVLTEIICAKGDFGDAVDPEGEGRDKPSHWSSPASPIATRDIFTNMLPDSRFWIGKPHPNDKILGRFEFFEMSSSLRLIRKTG